MIQLRNLRKGIGNNTTTLLKNNLINYGFISNSGWGQLCNGKLSFENHEPVYHNYVPFIRKHLQFDCKVTSLISGQSLLAG